MLTILGSPHFLPLGGLSVGTFAALPQLEAHQGMVSLLALLLVSGTIAGVVAGRRAIGGRRRAIICAALLQAAMLAFCAGACVCDAFGWARLRMQINLLALGIFPQLGLTLPALALLWQALARTRASTPPR